MTIATVNSVVYVLLLSVGPINADKESLPQGYDQGYEVIQHACGVTNDLSVISTALATGILDAR